MKDHNDDLFKSMKFMSDRIEACETAIVRSLEQSKLMAEELLKLTTLLLNVAEGKKDE